VKCCVESFLGNAAFHCVLSKQVHGDFPDQVEIFGGMTGADTAGNSSINRLFNGYVVTAPYLKYDSPTRRGPTGSGWAKPFVPRIIAIGLMHSVAIGARGRDGADAQMPKTFGVGRQIAVR
jgi:hypothetical protein